LPTEKAHGLQIAQMCWAFSQNKAKVVLYCPKRKNKIKEDFFSYYNVPPCFSWRCLKIWDLVGKIPRWGFRFSAVLFYLRVRQELRQKQGIFYTRDYFAALFFPNKKLVLELHFLPAHIRFYHRAFWRRFKKIIVISAGLKKSLVENGLPAEKIFVAPDGVNLAEFAALPLKGTAACRQELGLPLDKIILGYVGKGKTMGESKGVQDIMLAFARAQKKFPQLFFFWIGADDEERKKAEELLQNAKVLASAYQIKGHQPHSRALLYLQAADILAMNYPNTPHYRYFMSPLKLFEYLAAGKIILAPSLPSLREFLNEKNSFLFSPEDNLALFEKICYILSNYSSAQERAQQAKKDAEKYSWQKRAEKILNFLVN